MKKLKKLLKLQCFLIASLCLVSCDTFEDEPSPELISESEDWLSLEGEKTTLRGSSILFDLKSVIIPHEDVRIEIAEEASRGDLKFIDNGYLVYIPNQDYTEGTDKFSMSLKSNSQLIDIDEVTVKMASDSSGVPCFFGLRGNSIFVEMNSGYSKNVTQDAGLCEDLISSYKLTVEQPANGFVSASDYFVNYRPNVNFKGKDSFIYHLELVDLEGNSHLSSAMMDVEVFEDVDYCNPMAVWSDIKMTIESPYDEIYSIPIPMFPLKCRLDPYGIEVTNVSSGTATNNSDQNSINYIKPSSVGLHDKVTIDFAVTIEGEVVMSRVVTLLFQ